jgi:hypothetical protein
MRVTRIVSSAIGYLMCGFVMGCAGPEPDGGPIAQDNAIARSGDPGSADTEADCRGEILQHVAMVPSTATIVVDAGQSSAAPKSATTETSATPIFRVFSAADGAWDWGKDLAGIQIERLVINLVGGGGGGGGGASRTEKKKTGYAGGGGGGGAGESLTIIMQTPAELEAIDLQTALIYQVGYPGAPGAGAERTHSGGHGSPGGSSFVSIRRKDGGIIRYEARGGDRGKGGGNDDGDDCGDGGLGGDKVLSSSLKGADNRCCGYGGNGGDNGLGGGAGGFKGSDGGAAPLQSGGGGGGGGGTKQNDWGRPGGAGGAGRIVVEIEGSPKG